MRRVTVQKPVRKSSTTQRMREERESAPRERPEVRRDIAKTWWPDG
ncbi:hypothetical protein P8605_15785 [Streptomyces sp. T-3]|nr:hypothetical protein [Streptomyces sp. T-3]